MHPAVALQFSHSATHIDIDIDMSTSHVPQSVVHLDKHIVCAASACFEQFVTSF